MREAVIYTRVSTSEQAEEGVSLEAQLRKAKAYAELNDLRVVAAFSDEGISGTRADREGLQGAVKMACASKAVLIVYSMSRLARSTKLTIELSEKLKKSGVDLVSLSEKIDTTTASGKMVFRMLAVLNEFERDQTAERTAMALQHKKAKGERYSRHSPYGFTEKGGWLIPNEKEAEMIEKAGLLYRGGASYRKIATELNGLGYRNRKGKELGVSSIQSLLKRGKEKRAS